ncbi:hypothetical protein U9M48_022051 [Paspalum notatum var. saurae]|uniref:Embryo surrounding factor 1 brassicaceae domain-containing protein n=1 Tax=Paspalum notatum var. saurae TaxID=547442 RepID=A0AAQ3TL04_PASNO
MHPNSMKNMRNKCGVLALTLFLFAFDAQCRPHKQQLQLHVRSDARRDQQAYYYRLTNTTVDDESKLILKFCTKEECPGVIGLGCYCCKMINKCYITLEECWANCPTCNPKCPSN